MVATASRMRFFQFDNASQLVFVQHVDHVRAMCHLHRGRIRVSIDRNGLDAEALEFEHYFFTEFARAAEEDFRCAR